MSWFDTASFSKYAKSALKQAQKNIDKVLDIKDEEEFTKQTTRSSKALGSPNVAIKSPTSFEEETVKENDSFFSSFLGDNVKETKTRNPPLKIEKHSTPINNRHTKRQSKLRDRNESKQKIANNTDLANKLPNNSVEYKTSRNSTFLNKDDSSYTEISLIDSLGAPANTNENEQSVFTNISSIENEQRNFNNISDDTIPMEKFLPKDSFEHENENCISSSIINVSTNSNNEDIVKVSSPSLQCNSSEISNTSDISTITDTDVIDVSTHPNNLTTLNENDDNINIETTCHADQVFVDEILVENEKAEFSIYLEDRRPSNENVELLENDIELVTEINGSESNDSSPFIALPGENKVVLELRNNLETIEEICGKENEEENDVDDRNQFVGDINIVNSGPEIQDIDHNNENHHQSRNSSCTTVNDSKIENENSEIYDLANKGNLILESNISHNSNENSGGPIEIKEAVLLENNEVESSAEHIIEAEEKFASLDPNHSIRNENYESDTYNCVQIDTNVEKNSDIKADDCEDSNKDSEYSEHLIHVKNSDMKGDDCEDSNKDSQYSEHLIDVCEKEIEPAISNDKNIVNQVPSDSTGFTSDNFQINSDQCNENQGETFAKEQIDKETIGTKLDNICSNLKKNDNDNAVKVEDDELFSVNNPLSNSSDRIVSDGRNKQVDNERIKVLEKEINEVTNLLNVRESKIVELSKEHIDQQESIAVYRSQIEQLESLISQDSQELDSLREEFTKRISDSDKRLQSATKDRDYYKNLLKDTEDRLTISANEEIEALTNSLKEKEDTIHGLLTEGESLSKKELEANNRIKKLRMKLKEVIGEKDSNSEKLDKYDQELIALKEAIKEKTNKEQRLEDEVKKLEKMTDSQEDDISQLKDKLDDMEEKYKAMESTLHNAYSEINKLNLEKAQKESEVSEASSAVKAKVELENQLKELQKKSEYGRDELIKQLDDLQMAYIRLEQQSGRREDNLKRETGDLQKRLEEAEIRNQELSQSVSIATRPLLRQIENLQNNNTKQAENWEKIEKSLTDRLSNLQHQLEMSSEKEHSATEIAMELKSKYKVLEKQNKRFKEEKLKLSMELEESSMKMQEMENDFSRERNQLENQYKDLKKSYDVILNEKSYIEEQTMSDKVRYENDLMQLKLQLASQQVAFVRSESQDESIDTENTSAQRSPRRKLSISSSLMGDYSYTENGRSTTTTASFERLQNQLRKKEGEVFVLQEERKTLEKTKASLAKELVNLANTVEELEISNKELRSIKSKYDELGSRHNAVLQMYGEKAEEAEELKMDLADMKNMYRQQIEQLLGDR